MIWAIAILALVTAQRLGELVHARRNTARLIARGGREFGASHYPLMVALHAAWLASLWGLGWDEPVNWWFAGAYAVLQLFRGWILMSLGERWTTRIIVLPGQKLVEVGPYRFMAHPNYALVALEIACLPLVFGLWRHAVLFSVLNGVVLWWRIRTESEALSRWAAPSA